jgi:hypothetical protein
MGMVIVIVLAALGLGVAAAAIAERSQRASPRVREPRKRPAGYRAPAPTPEDEAVAPASAELLARVLAAFDAGTDPLSVDVETHHKRSKLAVAFTAGAIWAVRDRDAKAKWTAAIACAAWTCVVIFFGGIIPRIAASLAMIVVGGMLAAASRRKQALETLAVSDASPARVAAELRRLAGWPPAADDPLIGCSRPE